MIYFSLFWEFLKIGLFSFGGGYGAIPLIRDSVLARGWMNEEMIANVVALSESTPGPVMVNAATYIGASRGGILGSVLATTGVIIPAVVIVLLISVFMHKWIKNKTVQAVLNGIKPCIVGMIIATGVNMAFKAMSINYNSNGIDLTATAIILIITAVWIFFKHVIHKDVSPIIMIAVAAFSGAVMYA